MKLRHLAPLAALVVLAPRPAAADESQTYTLRAYLADVAKGSYLLAAQRYAIPAADAQIALAKVFPDPLVYGGLQQYDVTQRGNPTASVVGLTVPLQIGGQRGRRVDVAEAGAAAARADVDDFARTLRGLAASAFIDALHARLVVEQKERTLKSVEELVVVNEERYRVGDVGEAALLQSRVEAQKFHAEVLGAEGDVRARDLAMLALLGTAGPAPSTKITPVGDLHKAAERTFDADKLVATALAQRPDVIAARRRVVAADKQISLARSNRVPDIALGGYWQHNFSVPQPAQPESDWIGATLTVPIPFSRIWRGELDGAHAQHGAAAAQQSALERAVEVEVRQAVVRYDAAAARVRLYTQGMLGDAQQVLERTLFNFRRGGSSLVEVLVAQRTANDVTLAYLDALSEAARAAVDVEQAATIWDLDF
jgi:cobalt-zinc-cadmium efflux system outer membrane protein